MKFALTLLLSTSILSGCMALHDYETPEPPEASENVDLTDANSTRFNAAEPIGAWWTQFDDNKLPALVEKALAHNLDISGAIARVLEARALNNQQEFDYFPTITADSSYRRQRFNGAAFGGGAGGGNIFDNYSADLNGSWELDFLGRVSQRVEAAQARAQAREAELASMYVIVAADVGRFYMELRGAQQQLDIAKRNAANQERTFELTKVLFEGGRANKLDTARAQAQLQLTKATIPPLEAAVTTSIRRLSVLTGQVPDALSKELQQVQKLPSLPYIINTGNVSALLQRRPDILAAERELAATIADYNVASTSLFPTVNLIGSVGYIASTLSSFGTSAALVGNIGPTLSWRAFDLGRVFAEIDASDARGKAALANYEQIVLSALEETQNALTLFHREEQRRVELEKAAASAKEAADIAKLRFDYGADDFLTVLDAERTQLQAEDALAQSNTQAASLLVGIYRALGGGWQAVDMEQTLDNALEDNNNVQENITITTEDTPEHESL